MPLVHEAVKKLICVQDRTLHKRGEGGSAGAPCDLERSTLLDRAGERALDPFVRMMRGGGNIFRRCASCVGCLACRAKVY